MEEKRARAMASHVCKIVDGMLQFINQPDVPDDKRTELLMISFSMIGSGLAKLASQHASDQPVAYLQVMMSLICQMCDMGIDSSDPEIFKEFNDCVEKLGRDDK